MIFYKFRHSGSQRIKAHPVNKSVEKIYGNRVRTRVCGLCWEGSNLLMVNHRGLYGHDFWAPPGGGIAFGEAADFSLAREFKEETGLDVFVGEFQFACEYVNLPLHAIELFFRVKVEGGILETGTDPEMPGKDQIIKEVKYLSEREIGDLPEIHKHGLFRLAKNREKILNLAGYLKI